MDKKKLTKFYNSLTHLPTLVTIIGGAWIFFRHQETPMAIPDLLGWLIGLISLTATSMFIDRIIIIRNIEKNVTETNDFLKIKEGQVSLDNILNTRQFLAPLEERLRHAKEIKITGGSLSRLSSEYMGFFEELAQGGCSFKFLVLQPECVATEIVARDIVYETQTHEAYKSTIIGAIENLKSLMIKFPQRVQIRVTDIIPTCSLFICDGTKLKGSLMVELYPIKVPTRKRLHLSLLKSREPNSFEFYNEQFELMWQASQDLVY